MTFGISANACRAGIFKSLVDSATRLSILLTPAAEEGLCAGGWVDLCLDGA